ncbi:dynamin family protein [Trichocoleus sp. FACHB-46]|nr:dynamin family protein [Trichocoleus sp. FACHB-46]MBD1863906.1 dynamin family protein [Trichocoleus sp. FACHB-46]
MDLSSINSETLELLSRITGQDLRQEDLSPSIVFLSALITVLQGVMLQDGQITEEEKQQWQKTINRFIPPNSNTRQLVQFISKGVREKKVYAQSKNLSILTNSLSESERLLLIGISYEMSAVDGSISPQEKKYLGAIGSLLKIEPAYLTALEARLTNQEHIAPGIIDKLKSQLDPARFHLLDTIFVDAANDLLAMLASQEEQEDVEQKVVSYKQLQEFQNYKKQLSKSCCDLYQIFQSCNERKFIAHPLIEGLERVSEKLTSQKFKLAVVGEFSQGKSTLLNALLGEEIQPARAIPCSGNITVLKYGDKKRVTCFYKDGEHQEISVDKYKEKASISKDAARDHRSDELEQSKIERIVFEHPNLALCKNGVEIIDSPGLNEHPERTAITQKLLQDIDVAVVMTNAMRLLPEKEKELIQDIKRQLNKNSSNSSTENLFLVVNFMDLLDDEEDHADVIQRTEIFASHTLSITTKDRIHYISAKAALKSIKSGSKNEYFDAFSNLTKSIEDFLVTERGSFQVKQCAYEVLGLIQEGLSSMNQAESLLNGEIIISESEKRKIIEKIGEVSGRHVKLKKLARDIQNITKQKAANSWEKWYQSVSESLTSKSQDWQSSYSPVWNQKKLIQDYTDQFVRDLLREVDQWGQTSLQPILQTSLDSLNKKISAELDIIKSETKEFDRQVKTNLSEQLKLGITSVSDDFTGVGGFLGGIGAGGALAAALIFFTPVGLVSVILASLAAAVAGSFGLGMLDFDGLKNQIKGEILKVGLKKFDESKEKVSQKRNEIINSTFEQPMSALNQIIEQAISLYESLLEQQEKIHAETLEQRETDRSWIVERREALEKVQQQVTAILNQ